MQPYLFPYLGYFQLMDAVDAFVFYDDVQYIKGGWINRNRVQHDGGSRWFTVPVIGGSPSRTIREVQVSDDPGWRRKLIRSLEESYARAPNTERVVEMVRSVLSSLAGSIADLARTAVTAAAAELGIACRVVPTSAVYGNQELRGQERILDICRREGASRYVNLPGGRALYDPEAFRERGVELRFLEPRQVSYHQGLDEPMPNLSILDVLMWCSGDEARALLAEYDLR